MRLVEWFASRLTTFNIDTLKRRAVAGQWNSAIVVISLTMGIRQADFEDPARLRAKLDRFRRWVGDEIAVYALMLPMALAAANRPADALQVFNAVLDLPAGRPYAETVPPRLRDVDNAGIHVNVLLNLASTLIRVSRHEEAVDLVFADLAYDSSAALTSGAALHTALRARLDDLAPHERGPFLFTILPFGTERFGDDAFTVVQSILGLDDSGYGSPAQVGERLAPWFTAVDAPIAFVAVATLASYRYFQDFADDAVAIVEWYLRIDADDYHDPARLTAAWRTATRPSNPESVLMLLQVWVNALTDRGRTADAFAVLKADSGITETILADPALLHRKLADRAAPLTSSNSSALYVNALIGTLGALDRRQASVAVADWFLSRYHSLERVPEEGDPNVMHVTGILACRLRWAAPERADDSWEICGRAVAYLRASVVVGRLSLADRRKLAENVGLLRHEVRETSGRLAHDEGRAVTAQLWDAELGQRVLFEEFVLTSIRPVEPTEPPRDAWPLSEPEPTGPMPDFDRALQARPRRSRPKSRPIRSPEAPVPEPWLAEAEKLVRDGVTQELLADAVGTGGVLVRAGFRENGTLTWTALRVDGRSLRLVATGSGAAGDRTRLRWARLRYQIRLLISGADHTLNNEVWAPADALLTALNRTVHALGAATTDTETNAALAELALSSIAVEERLADKLRALLETTSDRAPQVGALAEMLTAEPDLDEATARYIADVADVWPIDPLMDRIDEDTDLVWQLEDVLQSFPVAYHRFSDGTSLFQRVRSSRVSLSLLLTIVQQRLDRESDGPAGRMLALSHFDPDDDAALYEGWFHHGLRQVAGDGVTCLHAAESPPGSIGVLRAALDDNPVFDTVSICGHGSADDAAIELADGVWHGDGCDWRGVGLLVLVSCSVGGLEQIEDREAEGLCVRLALHRARSVLACRWPVAAPHAIAFAREVVVRYLALEGPHRRARALNETRRTFTDLGHLNVQAAFELYGIG